MQQVQEEIRDPQPSQPDKADGATVWLVGSKRKREDDLVEDYQKLAAALQRAAKAEEERKAAARDLVLTQALQHLARAAEQDVIRERRRLRTQNHHVRGERDDLMAKAIIAKQKAKWLRGTASKQARLELKQMRDDREAAQARLLSQSEVGRQLAAAKETVRELSNKLIKQRTWRKEAAAIFKECGVQGPSFKPDTAPTQCATSPPMPVQHASSPPARNQSAASVLAPALFAPAQHASSPHVSAWRTASPTPPAIFREQAAVPQLPVAQLFSTLEQICAHFCL
ncbi:g2821 [Coccomyxa elongata]